MLSKYMIWLFKRGCWWLLVLVVGLGFCFLQTNATALAQSGDLGCGASIWDSSVNPWVQTGFDYFDPCPIVCTDITWAWDGVSEFPYISCNDGGGEPAFPPDKPGVIVGSVCQGGDTRVITLSPASGNNHEVQINLGTPQSGSGTTYYFGGLAEGVGYQFRAQSQNENGWSDWSNWSALVYQDRSSPLTTINPVGILGQNGWWTSNLSITLPATDVGCLGVRQTIFLLDGNVGLYTGSPFLMAGEGQHTLSFQSTDGTNLEAVQNQTYFIDTVPPTLTLVPDRTPDASSGWWHAPITMTLAAGDTTSGLNTFVYDLDSGGWIPYATPVIVAGDGLHNLDGQSSDKAGWVTNNGVVLPIDGTAPVLALSTNRAPDGTNGWWHSPLTVIATTSDATSGIAGTVYAYDSQGWLTYTTPVTVSGDGFHQVDVVTSDVAEHLTSASVTLPVDGTSPLLSLSPDREPDGTNGWWHSGTSVTATYSDATSGVASADYNYDNQGWQSYTMPVPTAGDGIHLVDVVVTDMAGHLTNVSLTIPIDGTAPLLSLSPDREPDGTNGWWRSPVAITATFSDETSGIAATGYNHNGQGWQPYTTPIPVATDGIHQVEVATSDLAAHLTTASFTVPLDGTPPFTQRQIEGPYANDWYQQPPSVTLLSADSTSGVAFTTYILNGESHLYTGPFFVEGEGDFTLTFYSTDVAGNIEGKRTVGFRSDIRPPRTLYALEGVQNPNGNFQNETLLTLYPADYVSGLAATYVIIDGVKSPYTAPLKISGLGTHTIRFYSTDLAENIEPETSLMVTLEAPAAALITTPPVTRIGSFNSPPPLPAPKFPTAAALADLLFGGVLPPTFDFDAYHALLAGKPTSSDYADFLFGGVIPTSALPPLPAHPQPSTGSLPLPQAQDYADFFFGGVTPALPVPAAPPVTASHTNPAPIQSGNALADLPTWLTAPIQPGAIQAQTAAANTLYGGSTPPQPSTEGNVSLSTWLPPITDKTLDALTPFTPAVLPVDTNKLPGALAALGLLAAAGAGVALELTASAKRRQEEQAAIRAAQVADLKIDLAEQRQAAVANRQQNQAQQAAAQKKVYVASEMSAAKAKWIADQQAIQSKIARLVAYHAQVAAAQPVIDDTKELVADLNNFLRQYGGFLTNKEKAELVKQLTQLETATKNRDVNWILANTSGVANSFEAVQDPVSSRYNAWVREQNRKAEQEARNEQMHHAINEMREADQDFVNKERQRQERAEQMHAATIAIRQADQKFANQVAHVTNAGGGMGGAMGYLGASIFRPLVAGLFGFGDGFLKLDAANTVKNYLDSQGLQAVGEVLYQRIMDGTIYLSPDLVRSSSSSGILELHNYIDMLVDPSNIASTVGGNGTINQVLTDLAIVGINTYSEGVNPYVRPLIEQIYNQHKFPTDHTMNTFFGGEDGNGNALTSCTTTASFALNIGRQIPQDTSPSSLGQGIPQSLTWRANNSGYTGVINFIDTAALYLESLDYIGQNGTGIDVTTKPAQPGEDIFSNTQIGDQILWADAHNATIVGYTVNNEFYPSYNDAQAAVVSGEEVYILIGDNQQYAIRPHTDVLTWDNEITGVMLFRDRPIGYNYSGE